MPRQESESTGSMITDPGIPRKRSRENGKGAKLVFLRLQTSGLPDSPDGKTWKLENQGEKGGHGGEPPVSSSWRMRASFSVGMTPHGRLQDRAVSLCHGYEFQAGTIDFIMDRYIPSHLHPRIQNRAGQIKVQIQTSLRGKYGQGTPVPGGVPDMNTTAPL